MHDLMVIVFAAALLISLVIDHYLGEPPVRWHPVVWMGNYLNWAAPHVLPAQTMPPDIRDLKSFLFGAIAWVSGLVLVLIAACTLQWAVLALPALAAALLLGLLLKPMLAWDMLRREVQAVEAALGESLDAGRKRLAMLVSRDTSCLSESQVRESAIESLAENLNDSVIAPIFWFVLLGLPGAAVYRFANTADAMWGYRGLRNGVNWEWAGKWAAWADDVLSWLPARITGLLLAVLAKGVTFKTLQTEARKTPSPNSGWPMAAMALALGVCLQKPGVYTLNKAGRQPQALDTALAEKQVIKVLYAYLLIALAVIFSKAFLMALLLDLLLDL